MTPRNPGTGTRKARPGEEDARPRPVGRGARKTPEGARSEGAGREKVSEIQRARMLTAMAEVAGERGAAGATVAQIVARSGVSRRTFYELFEDREDCFLAAFDQALGQAAQSVFAAYSGERIWTARVRAGLTALLCFLDEEPDEGRLCVVEAVAGGERARERRREVLEALTAAVDEGRALSKPGREPPPLTAEGVVGAVLGVIHARMLARTPGSLVDLANPLMGTIVLPYLGLAAAQKELARPQPEHSGHAPRSRNDPLKDLDMRLTYRTVRVLLAVGAQPGASNRQVADNAGVADQGQISKLLTRLEALGLIQNTGQGPAKGEPNAWTLTPKGHDLEQVVQTQTTGG
jgi:AcrR family transcriptional regulator/DNA-binding MarR family transcriptional regulator